MMFLVTRVLKQRVGLSAGVRSAQCNKAARTHLPPESLLEMGAHDSDERVAFAWGIEHVGQKITWNQCSLCLPTCYSTWRSWCEASWV